ncbi:carboxypeptidase regulatory-like domain-containing protein [Halorubrum distributum]|uniref:carboxypeptidase regulatory-like domain-containing protein n=1 Tax=Halorubrum distributum TaxID=29283 RepID=UPI002952C117|nr:carboxypeptidase regulatory-like domain-containing protein [Halorubrum distributum]MDV7350553.1 carboxypeptidase regulatory-like domain-containing protein [Halorubrum distributum]
MSHPTTDRAQSETVGVILLVTVFVVSASAIGVAYVGGVGSDTDEVVVSAELSADGTDLRVDHLGGDALANEELAVVVRAEGNSTRYPFAPPGEFAPGERRTFSDALIANATNEVGLYHEPSGEQIERTTLVPKPDPTVETGSIEGTVVGRDAASFRVFSGASFGVRQSVAPLSGAVVTVDGAGSVAKTRTGSDGTYRIDGLEPGEYEVSASAPGLAVSTKRVDVGRNSTTTAEFRLDPLRPAEFDVEIVDVDRRVNTGDPLTVEATVKNVGDEEGTQPIEFSAAGTVIGSEPLTLAGGERRELSLTWRPDLTDVGTVELAVASENDTATTTVEVFDPEGDGVAYVDRDGDGIAEETFSATELAARGEFDGHLVVFDDTDLRGTLSVEADRITLRDGVSLSAGSIDLDADGDVSIAGARIDTSFTGWFGLSGGDIEIDSGGRIAARGATVTATALAAPGDIDLSAADDVDLTNGVFNAQATVFFGSNGAIVVESERGTVTTDGAWFAPDPTVEAGDED